jgi:hypothetical protein
MMRMGQYAHRLPEHDARVSGGGNMVAVPSPGVSTPAPSVPATAVPALVAPRQPVLFPSEVQVREAAPEAPTDPS